MELQEMQDRYRTLKDEVGKGATRDQAEEILQIHTGLDITTAHGRDTPKRFVSMLDELTKCRDCLGTCMKWKVFEDSIDQMITIKNIPFNSVCNHHVVPFVGYAHVGYVPGTHIAGLSKFSRVVHHFARRLQVQEGLTYDVAEFLETQLQPRGVIVVMEAEHLCMTIRGVQTPGTTTRTVETRGVFSDHSKTAKMEFLAAIR